MSTSHFPIQLAACALFFQSAAPPAQESAQETALDQCIEELGQAHVERGTALGFVVGTLLDGEVSTYGFGHMSAEDERTPDADNLFEIGSISKVFTGLLLADAAQRELLEIDDPIRMHLPQSAEVPSFEGHEIRLVHLSTHTSALPRMPANFRPGAINNPYADYTSDDLYAGLGRVQLGYPPGHHYVYSNLGAGLLGSILCYVQGQSYEELVVQRIAKPLKMESTCLALPPELEARLVPGHSEDGKRRSGWDFDALAGAGAIRSSVNDMLKLAAAMIHPEETHFPQAIRSTQLEHHRWKRVVGLGWHFGTSRQSLWHNGQTGGYHALIAVQLKERCAVVVLANTSSRRVDALGQKVFELLREEATSRAKEPSSPSPPQDDNRGRDREDTED